MSSAIEQYLEDDHQRLDRLLEQLLGSAPLDHELFERFRAGLLRHIGLEEKLLLPYARRRGSAELGYEAALLRREHAALASLLVPTPDPSLVQEIADLLRQHNRREEGATGVYAQCVSLLGDEASAGLASMQATREPPLAPHFDGDGTVRTNAAALALAERAAAHWRRP